MKRYGYIYKDVCEIENIKLAINKASKGKKNRKGVKHILNNSDFYARKIQEMLVNKTYKPSPYIESIIFDGGNKKERLIHKPKFYPDQIIHWALMLQLEPFIRRGMYEHCCGSVPGKGSGWGHRFIEKWIRKDRRNTKYCLKLDISKFYQSINHDVLKKTFRNKFKDKELLWLVDSIIDSCDNGLPIGNYTSQWFANFLLQDLDHYIKEKLQIKYYLRYIDDMVLLGGNKKKLHKAKKEIESILNGYSLFIKKNWQVFKIDNRGLDFLGFRFFRNKTILRKRNALRIKRRIKKIKKKGKITIKDASAVVSYWGWIKKSNSYNFYNKHVKKYIKIKQVRRVISENSKHNNARKGN